MSAAPHRAGGRLPCFGCHNTYEDRVRGRKSSSRVVPKTVDTRGKLREKQAEAASLGRRRGSTRRREVQSEISELLSQQSLAKWLSFLEDLSKGDGAVGEDSSSLFTLEPFYDLYVGLSRLLKLRFVQYWSSDEMFRHSGGPAGKRKMLNLVRLPLLKACNAILPHTGEKYAVSGLPVDFAKKKYTTQLTGLFTEDGLRGMTKGRKTVLLTGCFRLLRRLLIEALTLWRGAT